MIRRTAVLAACLAWSFAAHGASCLESALERDAYEACVRDEILPLESRVVHLVNAVRAKLRAEPERLKAFERAHDAWNDYRNGQCATEVSLREEGSPQARRRAFAICTKRLLELRVQELEAL
ncbi:MAG: DUF1311 domain-containing protein [Betaproteobacteria bacterium]|nr:DUF1311 domain-containing protein [Betaproteobacteria bacterium]